MSMESYLQNLAQLKNADEEAAKNNRTIKEQLKSIKNELKTEMESKNIKFIPFGDIFIVLKKNPVKPTINDEFTIAVVKKYLASKNVDFSDQDAVNFLQVYNHCKDALTSFKTDIIFTPNKPIESLY